jgi:protein O-mannosyl-transferase
MNPTCLRIDRATRSLWQVKADGTNRLAISRMQCYTISDPIGFAGIGISRRSPMVWVCQRMSAPKRESDRKQEAYQAQRGTFVTSFRVRMAAGAAVIVLAVVVAYLPAITGKFVFDDALLLTKYSPIHTRDGLYRLWCTTESLEYYPVSYSMFWLEWRLWGLDPVGFHVTSLALHIVETLLIWAVLRRLSIPCAYLAAALFALHPVNVESVAWIAQQRNMMAMLFFLLSILWYLKALRSLGGLRERAMQAATTARLESTRRETASGFFDRSSLIPHPSSFYWLSLAAFVLAMLSKGSAAVLPVLVLGIIWWLRRLTWRELLRIAPFLLLAVALTAVNVWFQTHSKGEVIRAADFAERLLGAGGVVWFYLYKAFLPLHLAFVYPSWRIEAVNLLWWLPLSAAFIVSAVLWWFRRGWGRPLLFAWSYFCVSLVPVLGFTDAGFMKYSLVADHYQHIAIIGAIAAAAAAWGAWREQVRHNAPWAAIAAVTAFAAACTLAFLTGRQAGLYHDPIELYRATLQVNPECWLAYNNLGAARANSGRLQDGIECFQQSLQLNPNYAEAHSNLGAALARSGRLPEAIEHYHQAVRLKPDYANAHLNLGAAMAMSGRPQEAIECYQEALRLEPGCAEAYNNLGLVMAGTGRPQEAIEYFENALRLDQWHADAHNNLGEALVKTGRLSEAIAHFQQALRLSPDFSIAYFNLAMAYAQLQQSSDAVAAAQKALQLALSSGQNGLARKIDDWLNANYGTVTKPQKASPPGESSSAHH